MTLQNLRDNLGDLETFQGLLTDANVNERDLTNKRILHFAAMDGNVEAIRMIMAHNPDVNANANPYSGCRTALMEAARGPHIEAVRCLVEEFHANVFKEGILGSNAVSYAFYAHSQEIQNYLIGQGAEAYDANEAGNY